MQPDTSQNGEAEKGAFGLVTALLFAALFILSASYLHERPLFMDDSIEYVECAKSLVHLEGYGRYGNPETIWPPGYSFLLALPLALGLDSILVFKIINILLAVAALVVFYLCLRGTLGDMESVLLAAALGVYFPWIYYSHAVLSECLFSFVMALFLLFAVRYGREGAAKDLAGLTVTAMLLPVIRLAGISIFPAWAAAVFLSRGEDRERIRRMDFRGFLPRLGLAPIVVLPIVLWFGRNIALTGSWTGYEIGMARLEYIQSLNSIGITEFGLGTRIWLNVRGYLYIFLIPDQFGITRIAWLPVSLRLACVALWFVILLGWFRSFLLRMNPVFAVTAAGYYGMHVLLGWYDVRLLLPVMILLFLFLYLGAGWIIERSVRFLGFVWPGPAGFVPGLGRGLKRLLLVGFVVLNLGYSSFSRHGMDLRSPYRDNGIHFYEACRFLKARDTSGAILFAGKPGWVKMWSGKHTRTIRDLLDDNEMLPYQELPHYVGYLLLHEAHFARYHEEMKVLARINAEQLTRIFQSGDTVVYEVQREERGQ